MVNMYLRHLFRPVTGHVRLGVFVVYDFGARHFLYKKSYLTRVLSVKHEMFNCALQLLA